MEVALRYTLFTLFTLFKLLTLFILSKLLYTAQTVACMYLVLGRGRTFNVTSGNGLLVEWADEQWVKCWVTDWSGLVNLHPSGLEEIDTSQGLEKPAMTQSGWIPLRQLWLLEHPRCLKAAKIHFLRGQSRSFPVFVAWFVCLQFVLEALISMLEMLMRMRWNFAPLQWITVRSICLQQI